MIAVGQLIGNYRVERQLGEGGMGAVFVAVHEDIHRRAAIKVLHPHLARNPEIAHRFLNEARAANIIEHPGIVEIFEYARLPDETTYIVMEFLKGDTLTKRMARGLSLPETLRLSRQIASVLRAAHEKGIIHRDLKPDNVIIVADPEAPGGERAKLLDFGIAKVAEAYQKAGEHVKTQASMLLGTPIYMSPEQCRGAGEVTDKADVYSLGIMLYQMLCGSVPFNAVGLGDLLMMHTTQAPQPIEQRAPGLPEALIRLVHSMLAKSAAERPSMAQVVTELERIGAAPTGVLQVSPESLRTPRPGGTVVLPDGASPSSLPPVVTDPRLAAQDAALPATIHASAQQPSLPVTPVATPTLPSTPPALVNPAGPAGSAGASPQSWILGGVGVAALAVIGVAGYLLLKKDGPPSGPHAGRPDLGVSRPQVPENRPTDKTPRPAPAPPPGMVYVPGGTFAMGSTVQQIDDAFAWCRKLGAECRRDLYEREQPVREVKISGFFLDQTEVTNAQLAAWLNSLPELSTLKVKKQLVLDGKTELVGLLPQYDGVEVGKGKGKDRGFAPRAGSDQRPAVQVTWLAADRYCRAQGKVLPSEAQWEYAARGGREGAAARFPWGDEEPRCDGVVFGRVKGGACEAKGEGAAEVGKSAQDRSSLGLRDLAGNVSEWVADRFVVPYPACAAPCRDPRIDKESGSQRVIRGGNWGLPAESVRAAGRSRADEDKPLFNVGFRCARPAPEGGQDQAGEEARP